MELCREYEDLTGQEVKLLVLKRMKMVLEILGKWQRQIQGSGGQDEARDGWPMSRMGLEMGEKIDMENIYSTGVGDNVSGNKA